VVTDAIRSLVLRRAETREIARRRHAWHAEPWPRTASRKRSQGMTTLEEVSRVIRDT